VENDKVLPLIYFRDLLDPNVKNELGETPLIYACEIKYRPVTQPRGRSLLPHEQRRAARRPRQQRLDRAAPCSLQRQHAARQEAGGQGRED